MYENGTQNDKDFYDIIDWQFFPRPEKCRKQYYDKGEQKFALKFIARAKCFPVKILEPSPCFLYD